MKVDIVGFVLGRGYVTNWLFVSLPSETMVWLLATSTSYDMWCDVVGIAA